MTADDVRCPRCDRRFPPEGFHRNAARPSGRALWCKECVRQYGREYSQRPEVRARTARQALARYHQLSSDEKLLRQSQRRTRATHLKHKYGITLDGYDAMLAAQGGGCAICGREPTESRRLAVDHDHACCPGDRSCGNCVRGLLCTTCNVWLGFYENKKWIDRARQYIGREIERRKSDARN